jgi:hypothetical protein
VPSYTVACLSDIPPAKDPEPGSYAWLPVRRALGVRAFGVNAWVGPRAGDQLIDTHRETPEPGNDIAQPQEELYFVVRGHATFTVDGETVDAPQGTLVFVSEPAAERSAVAREDGTTVLAVGAPVGEGFVVSPWERKSFDG